MSWKELDPDLAIGRVEDAFAEMDCLSAVVGMAKLSQGSCIYVTRSCISAVMRHVASDRHEVGGLLVGTVHSVERPKNHAFPYLVFCTGSIASAEYRNSAVSLEMSPAVWQGANEVLTGSHIVVGWYHSHPGLGAFFSGTDRRTQSAFFRNPFSVGWVIDPRQEDQRVFLGPNSEEYERPILVMENEPQVL